MTMFDKIKLLLQLNKLWNELREVGIMKFLEGYKTYITLIVMIAHQAMKIMKLDPIPDDQLSIVVDVLLGILAGIFRKMAKPIN